MALNAKWSYKTFEYKQFVGLDPAEFEGEIVGSNFYQHQPFTDVFPVGIKTTFRRCNLDNCNIPETATVEGGCHNQIAWQTDGEVWIVGADLKPIVPRDAAKYDALGLSKDPANLPAVALAEPITYTNSPKVIAQRAVDALLADRSKLEAAALAEAAKAGG